MENTTSLTKEESLGEVSTRIPSLEEFLRNEHYINISIDRIENGYLIKKDGFYGMDRKWAATSSHTVIDIIDSIFTHHDEMIAKKTAEYYLRYPEMKEPVSAAATLTKNA